MFRRFIVTLLLIVLSQLLLGLDSESAVSDSQSVAAKITFLELGSTTCIPCVQMESVLEKTAEKYGDQIEIIFIDLMKERAKAKKYNVRIMPTQVFLDKDGKEINRHIGFYPQQQLDVFLQKQGLIELDISDE